MALLFRKPTVFAAAFGVGAASIFSFSNVHASEALDPPKFPWSHRLPWQSFDHHSVRRGYEVYKNVCATCHSLQYVTFGSLVNEVLTTQEAKEAAEEIEVLGEPNEEGVPQMRPGRLTDRLPSPYANEEEARFTNNGALPPDLSLMVKARPGGADYLYALLTGYQEPPAGVKLADNEHYNPYFPGGKIGMPPPLSEEQVDYEDGTHASISQMSKDVATFLCWAAEPEHDVRKLWGLKAFLFVSILIVPTLYFKRLKWSTLKTQKIRFVK